FKRHPDPTAGASTHGYTYGVLRTLPQPAFKELPLDLLPDREAARREISTTVIPHFPNLEGHVHPGSETAARTWLARAQEHGVADRWLRVLLGERMVPTRFNGWEAGISSTLPFVVAAAQGARVESSDPAARSTITDLDLQEPATRFGICQATFQRRLRGGAVDLLALLTAMREALTAHLGDPTLSPQFADFVNGSQTDAFFGKVAHAVELTFKGAIKVDESWLPELSGRPIHPRFAPHDPVEPLPWESRSPELYARRMERLGYVI
ncbi:MAG: hypothetical protein ACREQ5_32320, partial [Candidatus Dormibacteria bacterium]